MLMWGASLGERAVCYFLWEAERGDHTGSTMGRQTGQDGGQAGIHHGDKDPKKLRGTEMGQAGKI